MPNPLAATRQWRRRAARGLAAAAAAGMVIWTATAAAALPSEGYADLVEKVSPAVAFISSTQHAKQTMTPKEGAPQLPFPPDSPLGQMFRHFFEQMPQQNHGPVVALGSGFVIDPDGYIVTNNHVVEGADKIRVKLQDDQEYDAKLIGTDPQTDIALLKVKSDKPLPYVSFDNSDKLRVGDVVLAVGNPFGLGGTVTAGIVSARNRDIHAGPYDDFIQTDAAINRGNSGGPLFDTDGKVVGVNTAIYTPNGGSVGIGFAIPSNNVKDVVSQLKQHGEVRRGWLGVKIQAVTPDIAKAVGLDKPRGALVAEVTKGGPAEKAGLKQGDVITRYQGKPVDEMRDLPRLVAQTDPGATASVELWRDGDKQSVKVKIGKLKPEMLAEKGGNEGSSGKVTSSELGADLAALDEGTRKQLGLPEDVDGVLITALDASGPGAEQGLRPGDVIERVGANPATSPSQVEGVLRQARGRSVLLLVNRQGNEMFVGFKVAAS